MGASASAQEFEVESRPPNSRQNSARIIRPSSARHRPRSAISRQSSRGRSGSWKDVVRNAKLKDTESRNLLAVALGIHIYKFMKSYSLDEHEKF